MVEKVARFGFWIVDRGLGVSLGRAGEMGRVLQ